MQLQKNKPIRALITGANGFLGKNLQLWLRERVDTEVITFTRANALEELPELLAHADFVFHLAGINRPQDSQEFCTGNLDLTRELSDATAKIAMNKGKRIPVVFASSIQADYDSQYGQSKRAAEEVLFSLEREHGVPVYVFRLSNVFGKWSKPNYNSVVATFCYNIAHDLPIQINDSDAPLTLVYVDDVMKTFSALLDSRDVPKGALGFLFVKPEYSTTVGEIAELIYGFKACRDNLTINRVGAGLMRALYATYVSYLSPDDFSYPVAQYTDARGVFVEMLKTSDSGQFSFFTAHPGVSRGGHYHHSKTEKFLVIQGEARFKFRHIETGETYELTTSSENAHIVDTVPGWTHVITNIGQSKLIVMLWANEVFDHDWPDTYTYPL